MFNTDRPTSYGEARSLALSPGDPEAVVRATRTVLLFTLSDCFALVPEEILWAGYHLDRVLAPFAGQTPSKVPLVVRREMLPPHPFTQALSAAEAAANRAQPAVHDGQTAYGREDDWAGVFTQMITQTWSPRPMQEAEAHGLIVGLLRELGVGDAQQPRASRYLPNDVRHRLNDAG